MNTEKGYYIADGIYPPWSTFVKKIRSPEEEKYRKFVKKQKSCRKDV
jgi:hypothetical protein